MDEIVIEIFCTSMCCSGDHKLVYNDKGLTAFFSVSYKDMKKILNCFIKERTEICNFCKKCIDCQNFLFLYSQFNDFYLKIIDRNHNCAIISFIFCFNELKYLRKKKFMLDRMQIWTEKTNLFLVLFSYFFFKKRKFLLHADGLQW